MLFLCIFVCNQDCEETEVQQTELIVKDNTDKVTSSDLSDMTTHIQSTDITCPEDNMDLNNSKSRTDHISSTVMTPSYADNKSTDNFRNSKQDAQLDQSKKPGSVNEKETYVDKKTTRTQSVQMLVSHSEFGKDGERVGLSKDEKCTETERKDLKRNDVETQCSPIWHEDKEIQCERMAVDGSHGEIKNIQADDERSLIVFRHVSMQTDEKISMNLIPSDISKKNVMDNGVQCELHQKEQLNITGRQLPMVAGGRINGREHRAYGPTQSSDICSIC